MSAETPRYQQLKDFIIEQISTGALQPSDRVPSENELVESKRVSRMTANRALRELNDEGYVERIAGRGTFVSDYRARSHVLEVRNIADEISERGHRHSARVLRQELIPARGEIAKALHVSKEIDVVRLRLVHYENDAPVQVEDRYVVANFAPMCLQQDFTAVTPSAYLTGIAPLQEAEQVVRANSPNAETRQHLEMDNGEPCLTVVRRTWSDGRPVTFARLHHPGSRYELTGHYVPPGKLRTPSKGVVQLENLKQCTES